jgi:hypothetical protein
MIKKIKLKHLMYDELILCYGFKDYKKTMDRYGLYYENMNIKNGLCTSFYHEEDNVRKLIIGLKKQENIDDVKITLLHEIVHAVTFIMEAHDFSCDEYRAYTTCSIYKECCDALWDFLSGAK